MHLLVERRLTDVCRSPLGARRIEDRIRCEHREGGDYPGRVDAPQPEVGVAGRLGRMRKECRPLGVGDRPTFDTRVGGEPGHLLGPPAVQALPTVELIQQGWHRQRGAGREVVERNRQAIHGRVPTQREKRLAETALDLLLPAATWGAGEVRPTTRTTAESTCTQHAEVGLVREVDVRPPFARTVAATLEAPRSLTAQSGAWKAELEGGHEARCARSVMQASPNCRNERTRSSARSSVGSRRTQVRKEASVIPHALPSRSR